jgi:hypothetical protein
MDEIRSDPSGARARATPSLTVVEGGSNKACAAVDEQCAICGAEVAMFYVSMDWGAGLEAICGRGCADRLLDELDAFLRRQHPVGQSPLQAR